MNTKNYDGCYFYNIREFAVHDASVVNLSVQLHRTRAACQIVERFEMDITTEATSGRYSA